MLKLNFKKIAVFVSVLLLQPILSPDSYAQARKRPMKAYSFVAEGGKASQGECDGERKIPRLKRLSEFSKANSYMGSELQKPEIKGKIDGEMWKHFFRTKPACNVVLAKTPSALDEEKAKEPKQELPPDDSDESEDESEDGEKTEQAEPSEGPDAE